MGKISLIDDCEKLTVNRMFASKILFSISRPTSLRRIVRAHWHTPSARSFAVIAIIALKNSFPHQPDRDGAG